MSIKAQSWLACLLLSVLVFLIYFPVLSFNFVWDDWEYLVHNPSVQADFHGVQTFFKPDVFSRETAAQIYRPFRNFLYALEWRLWGAEPKGYHGVGIALHLLNCCLLFFFSARKLPMGISKAFLASCIFAIHPIQVETVTWIKAQDDLLAVSMGLSALLLLPRPAVSKTPKARVPFLASALFFLGACFCKEQAVSFLGIALILPWFFPERFQKASLQKIGVLGGVFFVYLGLRTTVLGQLGQTSYLGDSAIHTWFGMSGVGMEYFLGLVWPVMPRVNFIDWSPWMHYTTFQLAAFWVFGSALWIFLYCRLSVLRFYLLAILLAYLPVSNLLPMILWGAERFCYLPMIFIVMLCTAGWPPLSQYSLGRWLAGFFIPVLFIMWGSLNQRWQQVWHDNGSLGEWMMQQNPTSYHGLTLYLTHLKSEMRYNEMLHAGLPYLDVNPQEKWLHDMMIETCFLAGRDLEGHRLIQESKDRFPEESLTDEHSLGDSE